MTTKVEVNEAAQESVRASIEYVWLVLDSPNAAQPPLHAHLAGVFKTDGCHGF